MHMYECEYEHACIEGVFCTRVRYPRPCELLSCYSHSFDKLPVSGTVNIPLPWKISLENLVVIGTISHNQASCTHMHIHFIHCIQDGNAMLWDLNEGKHLYTLNGGEVINALVFSPNRYWLCAATGQSVKIWVSKIIKQCFVSVHMCNNT